MGHTFGKNSTRTSSAGNPITTASFAIVEGETVLAALLKTVGATDRAGGALTFAGLTLTQANSTQKAASSPEAGAELWYLLNPPIGSWTATIPNTNAATIFYTLATGKAALGGRSAFDTANGGNATSTNPTPGAVTVSEAGEILFAITAGGWQTWAPSSQAGTIIANTDDGAHGGGEQYALPALGSFTLNWTFGTSDDWGAVVAAFKEVPPPTLENYKFARSASTGIISVTEKIR